MMLAGGALASGDAEEAEATFVLGAEAYGRSDYTQALAHFLASNRLAPNASVAFNIARCYARLNEYASAYRWFSLAAQGLSDPRIQAAVQDELRAITPRVVVYDIQTDPPGVTVFAERVDLGAIGETPLRIALPPNDKPRTFILQKEGWLEETLADVGGTKGDTIELKATLDQVVGTVQIHAPDGTSVHQGAPDGPVVCAAPCDAMLPPGNWVLYFRRDGFRDAVRQLEVVADRSSTVLVELSPNTGSVVVDATERGSLVEIDGAAVGFTPTVVQGVPVGSRVVRVSRPGYQPVTREVTVETDQQVALDGLQLLPMNEVTAVSRRAERLEVAPSSVTVISQDELRAFQYPTIYEALRGVRGVALTYDSIYGAAAVRGLGQANDFGNRLLILQDGAILNDNILYQSFISYDGRVDLGGIERIEVVRGPGSVLYGTGAVSGVVNLVTESPEAPEGTGVHVGTYDNKVLRARVETHYNFDEDRKFGFRAAVSGAGSQGRIEEIDPRGGANPPIDVSGFDKFVGGTTTGRVWLGGPTVQWYHSYRSVDIPTGVYATVLGNPSGTNEWIDTRTMVEAKVEPQVTESLRLSGRAYFNRYQYDGILPYGPYTSVEKYIGMSIGGEARAILELGEPFRLTAGGEYVTSPTVTMNGEDQYRNGDVESYLESSEPYQLAAGYALVDLVPVDSVRLTAGGRADYWSTFGVAVSPRLALVLTPDDGDVVKVLGGRAFRAPSIFELYYEIPDVQIRPDDAGNTLVPETVWSGELEYSHAFDQAWTGLVAGHASLANQLIESVAAPGTPGAVTYKNSDRDIRILGLDFELRRGFQGGWMLSTFYSYLDSRYEDGELVPNVPQSNAGLKVIVPVSAPQARVAFRTSLETPRRIDLSRDDTTGWAVVSDLVLSGQVPERSFEYAVGIYNLFDQDYALPLTDTFPLRTVPQQGRSLMATLGMGF
jgi:outer membrane receptor for ferrienterochelin and colicins